MNNAAGTIGIVRRTLALASFVALAAFLVAFDWQQSKAFDQLIGSLFWIGDAPTRGYDHFWERVIGRAASLLALVSWQYHRIHAIGRRVWHWILGNGVA
jgi:hypothetical protein